MTNSQGNEFQESAQALWIRKEHMMTEKMTMEQWLAIRKEAGLKIDPETAAVDWNSEDLSP